MADDSQYCEPVADGKGAEIWRPVPSEPGVLASSWGRIVLPPSHAPLPSGNFRLYVPKPTFGAVSKSKREAQHTYRSVMVKGRTLSGGRQRPRKVHQLVCEAFHGPKPFPSAVVIHADENAHNNRPENLRWGTQKENLNAPGFVAYCRRRRGPESARAKWAAAKAQESEGAA